MRGPQTKCGVDILSGAANLNTEYADSVLCTFEINYKILVYNNLTLYAGERK